MSEASDAMRKDRGELERALKVAGCDLIRGNTARCPFHEDKSPSMSIHDDDSGVWRATCHLPSCFGGDVFDVLERATGKSVADQLRELKQPAPVAKKPTKVYASSKALSDSFRAEATYQYAHPESGAVEMVVVRFRDSDGKKCFCQCRPEGSGFVLGAPPKPHPIYNRKRVIDSPTVVVVEGEKCVHALHELNIVSTTNPGGALKGEHADWSHLAGKTVYLWPDHDAADPKTGIRTGLAHMRQVADILQKLEPAPSLLWIDSSSFNLPEKTDVVDYLATYGGSTKLERQTAIADAMESAEPIGASAGLKRRLEETIAGKRRYIPWPYRSLTFLSRDLVPGMVTCLASGPGFGKTLLTQESAALWIEQGIKVAMFELEDDKEYHLGRIMAQHHGDERLADNAWVERNAPEVREAYEVNRPFLDEMARCIWDAPDEPPTLPEVLKWLEQRCLEGFRIIIIDPITAAKVGDRRDIEDFHFIMRAKAIIRKYGASLVLVTHTPKTSATNKSNSTAGGAAYERFAHTTAFLIRHDIPKKVIVSANFGPEPATIDRSVRLGKTRNGPGAGVEIGFNFDVKTLRFIERGAVTKQKSADEQLEQIATEGRAA